jgi:hypothetical protein
MNDDRTIQELARQARSDRPPLVDVTDTVMDRLGEMGSFGGIAVRWSFAVASVAAAIVLAMVAAARMAQQAEVIEIMPRMMAVLP